MPLEEEEPEEAAADDDEDEPEEGKEDDVEDAGCYAPPIWSHLSTGSHVLGWLLYRQHCARKHLRTHSTSRL